MNKLTSLNEEIVNEYGRFRVDTYCEKFHEIIRVKWSACWVIFVLYSSYKIASYHTLRPFEIFSPFSFQRKLLAHD